MLRINVDKRSIDQIEELANLIDSVPVKIKMANSRAASMATKDIRNNLAKRGRPGEVIDVSYSQYGEFGLKFELKPKPGRGGYNGGRSKSGKYSILYAARIFMNSEQGRVGRRAFTLPRRTSQSNISGRYVLSHSSGQWQRGQRLSGPLKIPALGPFYFSSKSGMPREKISTFSRGVIKGYLNRYYDNLIKRSIE